MYHGPRENVVEFFEQQGFVCPERKGVADFLQEVTSRKDQKVVKSRLPSRLPSILLPSQDVAATAAWHAHVESTVSHSSVQS